MITLDTLKDLISLLPEKYRDEDTYKRTPPDTITDETERAYRTGGITERFLKVIGWYLTEEHNTEEFDAGNSIYPDITNILNLIDVLTVREDFLDYLFDFFGHPPQEFMQEKYEEHMFHAPPSYWWYVYNDAEAIPIEEWTLIGWREYIPYSPKRYYTETDRWFIYYCVSLYKLKGTLRFYEVILGPSFYNLDYTLKFIHGGCNGCSSLEIRVNMDYLSIANYNNLSLVLNKYAPIDVNVVLHVGPEPSKWEVVNNIAASFGTRIRTPKDISGISEPDRYYLVSRVHQITPYKYPPQGESYDLTNWQSTANTNIVPTSYLGVQTLSKIVQAENSDYIWHIMAVKSPEGYYVQRIIQKSTGEDNWQRFSIDNGVNWVLGGNNLFLFGDSFTNITCYRINASGGYTLVLNKVLMDSTGTVVTNYGAVVFDGTRFCVIGTRGSINYFYATATPQSNNWSKTLLGSGYQGLSCTSLLHINGRYAITLEGNSSGGIYYFTNPNSLNFVRFEGIGRTITCDFDSDGNIGALLFYSFTGTSNNVFDKCWLAYSMNCIEWTLEQLPAGYTLTNQCGVAVDSSNNRIIISAWLSDSPGIGFETIGILTYDVS